MQSTFYKNLLIYCLCHHKLGWCHFDDFDDGGDVDDNDDNVDDDYDYGTSMKYPEILLKLRQFFESDIFLLQHLTCKSACGIYGDV